LLIVLCPTMMYWVVAHADPRPLRPPVRVHRALPQLIPRKEAAGHRGAPPSRGLGAWASRAASGTNAVLLSAPGDVCFADRELGVQAAPGARAFRADGGPSPPRPRSPPPDALVQRDHDRQIRFRPTQGHGDRVVPAECARRPTTHHRHRATASDIRPLWKGRLLSPGAGRRAPLAEFSARRRPAEWSLRSIRGYGKTVPPRPRSLLGRDLRALVRRPALCSCSRFRMP